MPALARRLPAWPEAIPAALALVAVPGLAAASGGYFPTQWGWAALVFLLVAASAVIVRDRLPLHRLDSLMLAALGALGVWVAASLLWSVSFAQPVLEAERTVVYVGLLAAVFLTLTRPGVTPLLAALLLALAGVSAYGLATRLFPDRLGTFPPGQGYQLSEPIGYWNALGLAAALAALLALGFAAHARSRLARAGAAASLLVLAPTLYFTFSRGSWLALIVGALAALAVDPRRLRLAVTGLAVALPAGLAVLLASRSDPLTREGSTVEAAARDGHRLAVALVLLAAAAAALVVVLDTLERRFPPGPAARRAAVLALVGLALVAALGVFGRAGSPWSIAGRAYDAFRTPLRPTEGDLNRRLVSLSGNGRADYWRVAWDQYVDHPVLGAGAGSFERFWLRDRPTAFYARDAHNLYLETLAELGPVGLALLLVALAVPLVAVARSRNRVAVAGAAGAYTAFLAHAALDWDWEITSVAVPALLCGAALVVSARGDDLGRPLSARARAVALAVALPLAGGILAIHAGNSALAASDRAGDRSEYDESARHARRASRWAPWSYEPWQLLGEAQLARADEGAARASFREALERDPHNWSLWFELALASDAPERDRALARAEALNPLAPELAELRTNE